jgi:integral membrane protein (TIGR01906 family)
MDKTNVRLKLRLTIYWISFALIILILPIVLILNLKTYFFSRFEINSVYEEFSKYLIDEVTVKSKFVEVIDYLHLQTNSLDVNFFSIEDRLHLKDVRVIIITLYSILLLSLAITLIRRKEIKDNIKTLTRISTYYLTILIPFLLLINHYYDYFFTLAHRIVFSNEYWLLDPRTSNLIKMFPQNIFYEIFQIVVISNILMHGIFIFIVISKHEKLSRK